MKGELKSTDLIYLTVEQFERNYISRQSFDALRAELEDARARIEELKAAEKTNKLLKSALFHISELATEWNANMIGPVAFQRKRWLRLGEIARNILRSLPESMEVES